MNGGQNQQPNPQQGPMTSPMYNAYTQQSVGDGTRRSADCQTMVLARNNVLQQ
jgi:hypothetical protein